MTDAAAIVKLLGGHGLASGGYICRCPGPGHGAGHGDRRPSLSVADGATGLIVHCFAGCAPADVLAELRGRHVIELGPREPARRTLPVRAKPDKQALTIWREASPIAGTLAEQYLIRHRGLVAPFPPSLRFAPSLRYPPSWLRLPAMVAAIQRADGGIVAVQATFLRASDGAKAPTSSPRWTFGRLGDGAVRLAAAGRSSGLAEGIEDALAARQFAGVACWAVLGSARLHSAFVPEVVETLHLFADNDEPGLEAAARAASVHRLVGRTVVTRFPPEQFKDWEAFAQRKSERSA